MHAAFGELEAELAKRPQADGARHLGAAEVATAVAWRFTDRTLPGALEGAPYPRLRALSAWAEQLPEFIAAPHGDGTVQPRR